MKKTILNHKFLKIVLLFAAFAALTAMLAGCAGLTAATDTSVSFAGGSSLAFGDAPQGGSYREGDVITLPECAMTREGYVFTGWSDGEKTYQPGQEYTVGIKAVKFTAVWARDTLTIRFKNYDGSLLWETTLDYGKGLAFGYGGKDPTVPESDRTGYRMIWDSLDGWEPAIPELFTEDTVLTAKFSYVPIEYEIRYYLENEQLYGQFFENYGDPLKTPGKNPEKNVPESEIHVERYEFVGWKKKGASDSSAVLPDGSGAIGTVVGEADFVPVFRAVNKIYTIALPENPVGYTVSGTGGVSVGGSVKLVLTLDDAYSASVPHASVNFGGEIKPVVLTHKGSGVYEGSIENIEREGILSVADVVRNRYSVTVSASNAAVLGWNSEDLKYAHGDAATFIVVPNEHYRRSAPIVTRNGVALEPVVTDGNGVTRYEYSFVVTEETEISVQGVVDVYTVTMTDGYGSVSSVKMDAGAYYTIPDGMKKPSTEQYDFVFRDATEQNGKVPRAFKAGEKVEIWDDYKFIANFNENLRKYTVTIRVPGEETTKTAPYGTAFSEVLPEVAPTIVEPVLTHTFTGWILKGAETDTPLPADAAVKGNAVVEAVYESAPTRYAVTFHYLKDGEETPTVVEVEYNAAFSDIEKPVPDDRTAEGKYFVWVSADGKELDGTVVTSALSATAEYRVFVYTVAFRDETGEERPEWTQSVEWGAAATAPQVPAEYKTETDVYTFTGWSEDFASVKSDLTVRPLYERATRYYAVTLRSETDAGATLTEVSGDRTYQSVYEFRLDLSESVDAANVKVFLKLGGATAVEMNAEENGNYRFSVTADAAVYLEGVGVKKLNVTLPVSETYTVTPSDDKIVEYGGSFRFTVQKGEAYSKAVLEVRVNGVDAPLSPDENGVYTVKNIKTDVVVAIPDLPINVYAVTTEKGDGIAEIIAPETVEHGGGVVFTVTLEKGYSAAGLKYETSATGLSETHVGNVYTVTLSRAAADVSIRFYGTINRYRVTVPAGANFTSDVSEATVEHGGTFTAVLTPAERYNRNAPRVSVADARIEKTAEGVYRMTVSGVTGDLEIAVTPILDVYTLTVTTLGGIVAEGDSVRTIKEGESAKLRFYKGEGFTQTAPTAALSNGTTLVAEDEGDAWSVTVPAVFGDLTLTIGGILNVYRITLPNAAAQSAGGYTASGEATAEHGTDYRLTVTPDASRNLTPPTVKLDDGTALAAPIKKDGGYVYTIPAVKGHYVIASVITVINVYSVTFALPNGETIEKSLTHGDPVVAPIDVLRTQFNETAETADYVAGWTKNGSPVAYDFAGETATGSVAYTAVKRTRYYTAKIGDKAYLFLETAIEAATTGQMIDVLKPGADASVELGGGKTVSFDRMGDQKEYELKSGVTLRLPYNAGAYSNFADNDKTRYNTAAANSFADKNPNFLYVEVALGAGYTLNAHGAIEIGGIISQPSVMMQGHTSGNYAQFTINGTLNVYGTLKTFGYVKGTGSVDAMSGAVVYSPFVVYDYRGGTNTVTVAYKNKQNTIICPFNIFEFPNIQPGKYTVRDGAKEYGYASLYASSSHNATIAQIITSEGDAEKAMFYLSKGAKVEKTYDAAAKVGTYTFYGAFRDGELYLTISVGSVSSKSFLLPVPYHFNITLAEGALATLSMRYKFMPGSVLMVKSGAKIVLAQGSELIAYQEYVPDPSGQKGYAVSFQNTEYNLFFPKNTPAEIRIDGELEVSGTFGGAINGSGRVTFADGATVSITSKEGNSGDTKSWQAFLGGNFYTVYETTQTARGNVGGVPTEFQPGNTYQLS